LKTTSISADRKDITLENILCEAEKSDKFSNMIINIVDEIDRMGYDGFFGLEYWPSLDYEEPLRRTLEYFS